MPREVFEAENSITTDTNFNLLFMKLIHFTTGPFQALEMAQCFTKMIK
jgi:hypothetical protein